MHVVSSTYVPRIPKTVFFVRTKHRMEPRTMLALAALATLALAMAMAPPASAHNNGDPAQVA